MKHILKLSLTTVALGLLTACNPGLIVKQHQLHQTGHYQQPSASYYRQPATSWGYITGEPLLQQYGYGYNNAGYYGNNYGYGQHYYSSHPVHESISVY